MELFEIRVTSQNLDWGLRSHPEKWKAIVDRLKKVSDVILLQEAKWTHVKNFADDEWAVYQDTRNDATAGTAVMWRKSLGPKVGARLHSFVPHRRGVKLPTRYVAEVDIHVKEWDETVTFGSFHYPPMRFRWLWPIADRAVTAVVRKARSLHRAFVYGSDFNDKVGKDVHDIGRRLGLRIRGIRIDGFAVARRLKASKARDLGNDASDHNPVQIKVVSRRYAIRLKRKHKK